MENVSKVRLKHLKRLSGAVKGTPVTGAPTSKHENQCKWTAGKQALVVVGSRCTAVNWASAASVSNVDWLPPTVRQLHGEPTG